MNFHDIQFEIARKYLHQIHTNLINYVLLNVDYQVVTGVTFIAHYIGLDLLTEIYTKVYVNLIGIPSLIDFNISCSAQVHSDCTNGNANKIYNGV